MIENWDKFPNNIAEMFGPITRKEFTFLYSKIEVWQNGECIHKRESQGKIVSKIVNQELFVNIDDFELENYINKQFSFGEISTNGDRVMWSKDIFNSTDQVEYNTPDISSLFFKNGILSKVTYTIYNPNTLVEFYK